MKILTLLFVGFLAITLTSNCFAESATREANVLYVEGNVDVKLQGNDWVPAQEGMALNEKDAIRTGQDSWALLEIEQMGGVAEIEIKESSELSMAELAKNDKEGTQSTLLDLAIGEVLITASKLHTPESKFEVKTPTSIVGVRGTKFSVKVDAVE